MMNKNDYDFIAEKFEKTEPEVPLRLQKENIKRLVQQPKEQKRTVRIPSKALISIAACLVLLVTGVCGVGAATGRLSSPALSDTVGSQFALVVYAEENGETVPVTVDGSGALPQDRARLNYFEIDGGDIEDFFRENLQIKGENIEEVSVSCKTGSFYYFDYDYVEYLQNRGEYYDIIVPYEVIQGKDYYIDENNNYVTDLYSDQELIELMLDYAQNSGDERCFLREPVRAAEDYTLGGIVNTFENEAGDTLYGVISVDTLKKIDQYFALTAEYEPANEADWPVLQQVTMVNYLDRDAISLPAWFPAVFNHFTEDDSLPSEQYSELTGDILTVTVTFKDGTQQTADYDFSFDDDGWLTVSKI